MEKRDGLVGASAGARARDDRNDRPQDGRLNDWTTDPVCGMAVDPAAAPHHADHEGRTYHFCSAGCRERFVARPAIFLGKDAPRRCPEAPPNRGDYIIAYALP